MGVKSDSWIKWMSEHGFYFEGDLDTRKYLISPFEKSQISENVISYGLSSYGYDFRLSEEFKTVDVKVAKEQKQYEFGKTIIDPKKFPEDVLVEFTDKKCIVPPGQFVLGKSLERFTIPRDILGLCIGKSTYARCGLIVNITPLEPEWEGYITISILNVGPFPVLVSANEGIAQVIFIKEATKICTTSYRDRKGKYNNSESIITSKVSSK